MPRLLGHTVSTIIPCPSMVSLCVSWYFWASIHYTMCPRSLDPFYIVSYFIKLAKTSWKYSSTIIPSKVSTYLRVHTSELPYHYTMYPRSLDPFYIVTYYINFAKTSWAYSKYHHSVKMFRPIWEHILLIATIYHTIMCPRSLDLFYIVTHSNIKLVKTSWKYSKYHLTMSVNVLFLFVERYWFWLVHFSAFIHQTSTNNK